MSVDVETNFHEIALLVKAGLERNAGVHPATVETGPQMHFCAFCLRRLLHDREGDRLDD